MTISVSTTPAAPGTGDEVTLSAVGSAASIQATTFRYDLTSVPAGSALKLGLLEDGDGNPIATFTGDVAGSYGFNVYSYVALNGAARFDGDPDGQPQTKFLETFSFTVVVGQSSTLLVQNASKSGATLRIVVTSGNVVAAELLSPTDAIAEAAIADAGVVAALAALVGVAVGSMDVDFIGDVRTIQTKYTAHIAYLGVGTPVHLAADTVNGLTLGAPYSVDSAIAALNEVVDKLAAHQANLIAHAAADTKNAPYAARSTMEAQEIVAKADYRRVFGAHLAQVASPAAHGSADATNTLSAAAPLPALIASYLGVIATTASLAPAGFTPA